MAVITHTFFSVLHYGNWLYVGGLLVTGPVAMIFVLLHCHPATKKFCPHAEVMLAFRDHGIITTSSNKTEPNVTYTNRLVLVHHRNFCS